MKIGLKERTSVIILVRLDDVPSRKSKLQSGARVFLESYVEELGKQASKHPQCDLQDFFFILGRASMALFLTCPTLSDVPQLVRFITSVHDELREEKRAVLGSFETFSFPCGEIRSSKLPYAQETRDKIIPVLVFVRTPEALVTLIQRLSKPSNAKLLEHIFAIYSGFGVYNVIFYLKFKTLYGLRDNTILLRQNICNFWETSTLVGVPSRKLKKREESLARLTQEIQFSISAKCADNLADVAEKIRGLSKKIKDVTFRQGYMDIEARYSSKTVSDAFDFSCKIRRIDGVTDTCTVAQLPAPMNQKTK